MILGIDTTTEKAIIFLAKIRSGEVILVKKTIFSGRGSDKVIKKIDLLLKSNKLSTKDLDFIVVNPGPQGPNGEEARFTATRVGVSIANAFAFALSKKIAAFRYQNNKIVIGTKKEIILPKYFKPANITRPKN